MKDNLILHHDTLSVINELSDEQAGQLIKEIFTYSVYINNPNEAKEPNGLNGLLKSVAHPFKMQLDRDLVKYSKVVERNAENGKKGGRPKKEETQKKPTKPKKADSVSDSVNDSVSDSDIFTFSLKTQKLLSSTSKEYQEKLRLYIFGSDKQMTYQDFYNQCEMKPYKYKNFKMAYDSWNKKDKQQPQSFKQQDKATSRHKVNAYLDSGVSLRDNHEPSQEVYGFPVVEDLSVPTNTIRTINDGEIQDIEVITNDN